VHCLSIHPHHKIAHRSALWQGKYVGSLSSPWIVIDEDLIHRCGHLVLYLDVHMMVLDGQRLVQAHVHSRWRIDDDDSIRSCGAHQA